MIYRNLSSFIQSENRSQDVRSEYYYFLLATEREEKEEKKCKIVALSMCNLQVIDHVQQIQAKLSSITIPIKTSDHGGEVNSL